MPRYYANGRVLDFVRQGGGSFRYRSELSILVEGQLNLDLEGLYSGTGLFRVPYRSQGLLD
jgi:hypothetical protein